MLTVAQLRTFEVVARLNSFSRAAQELHLSQPAISAQVATLEKALGVQLFDRVGRRVVLTAAGAALQRAAIDINARLGALTRELRDLAELKAGSLRIGASQVVGVYLMPEILAAFRRLYPAIELTVRVEAASRILDMVAGDELDVALVGEGAPVADDRVRRRPIRRDELLVIVPRGHVFAEMASVPPSSLAQMTFLLPRLDSASSRTLLEQLEAEGIRPQSVLELGNVGAVKRAVEAGLGISVVSRCAVLHELADRRLCPVSITGLDLERQIALCWSRERPPSACCTAFMDLVARDWPRSLPD
ncbi:MAG: LysR family transcriptional regulator [bacterium]|nr:LysR family transcriptional regulator [bacterium]